MSTSVFPKAEKVAVYKSPSGQLLKRLSDAEGKLNAGATRYETGKKLDGSPIVAYFVPVESKPAESKPESK